MRTVSDLLDAAAARGDAPALIAFGTEGVRELSGAALVQGAQAVAKHLLRSGVRHGEPVMLLGPNSIEWVLAYFGILEAGALPVSVDCLTSPRDLAHILADSGARRVFTAAHHADVVRSASPSSVEIIPLDEPQRWAANATSSPRADDLPGLLPRVEPTDTAALLYTSGTTGLPKGVPLTHRNIIANVEALVATNLVGPADRVLVPLPLHHSYPFTCGLLGCLATGAAFVMPAGVTGPQLIAAIRGAGVTVLLGVPRLYTALLDGIRAKATAGALSRRLFGAMLPISAALARTAGLRIGRQLFARLHREMGATLRILGCGGAPLPHEIAEALEGLGWEVLTGYGLTETAPILTFNVRGKLRHDTAGWPVPGVQIRIASAPGESTGEILAQGPNVFAGYLNNPEATRAAFTADGWFRTGDLGWLDRDGSLLITGRVKELIVLPDGKKVFPETVEQALVAIPLIREAAVLEQGGRLVALIVPDEDEIRRHGTGRIEQSLRERIEAASLQLPAYQRITDYRVIHESLPRTPLGKIQRFRLPAIFAGGRAVVTTAPSELSAADRALLDSDTGTRIWAWLVGRFPDKPVTLDASPQLDLQVDSLEWLALTLEIRDRFAVNLGQDAVARILTVRDLVNEILAGSAQPTDTADVISAEQARHLEPAGGLAPVFAWLVYAFNRLVMRALFRVRVAGLENLPPAGPYLLTPNHASYLDPLAIAAVLPPWLLGQVFWAGWTGFMFRNAFWRAISRVTHVFPVDPDRGPASAIASGEAVLGKGRVLVWFPEGRRTLTGETGPFLPGVGVVLERSSARAVPVHVTGSYACWPWYRRWPRPGRIAVTIGAPASAAELEAAGEGATRPERIASGLRRAVLDLGAGQEGDASLFPS